MKLADVIVTAPDYTKSIKAGAAHYDEEALAVETYILEGQARALSLGTRDPIRCNDDGHYIKTLSKLIRPMASTCSRMLFVSTQ